MDLRRCLSVAAALAALLASRPAGADTARQAMQTYFAGEQRGGLILYGLGAAGIGAGAVLVTRDSKLARGAGYPALILGVVHVAAGVFVRVTSDGRIEQFSAEIERDPTGWASAEAERIDGVRTQFLVLKIVEIALIAGGGAALVYGLRDDRDVVAGIGAGVAVEAAATLLFDIAADRRASRYQNKLWRIGVGPTPGGGAAAGLAISF